MWRERKQSGMGRCPSLDSRLENQHLPPKGGTEPQTAQSRQKTEVCLANGWCWRPWARSTSARREWTKEVGGQLWATTLSLAHEDGGDGRATPGGGGEAGAEVSTLGSCEPPSRRLRQDEPWTGRQHPGQMQLHERGLSLAGQQLPPK